MNREQRRAMEAVRARRVPGDIHIPQEFQALRGTGQRTGPMAQAAVVEGLVTEFIRKVGLTVDVERNDSGWVLTVTRPEPPELTSDGVKVE